MDDRCHKTNICVMADRCHKTLFGQVVDAQNGDKTNVVDIQPDVMGCSQLLIFTYSYKVH